MTWKRVATAVVLVPLTVGLVLQLGRTFSLPQAGFSRAVNAMKISQTLGFSPGRAPLRN